MVSYKVVHLDSVLNRASTRVIKSREELAEERTRKFQEEVLTRNSSKKDREIFHDFDSLERKLTRLNKSGAGSVQNTVQINKPFVNIRFQ